MKPEEVIIEYLPNDVKMIRKFPSREFLEKRKKMKRFLKQQEEIFLEIHQKIKIDSK